MGARARPPPGWPPGRAPCPPGQMQLHLYRRQARFGVLRRGSALLGLAAGLFAALQADWATAQCTGGGLSDEVLCRALGKECGEVLGASSHARSYRRTLDSPASVHMSMQPLEPDLIASFVVASHKYRQLWHYDHVPSMRGRHDLHRSFLLPQIADMR